MNTFMEERDRIFADSNYFIALFSPADSLHIRALEIAEALERKKHILVISNSHL